MLPTLGGASLLPRSNVAMAASGEENPDPSTRLPTLRLQHYNHRDAVEMLDPSRKATMNGGETAGISTA